MKKFGERDKFEKDLVLDIISRTDCKCTVLRQYQDVGHKSKPTIDGEVRNLSYVYRLPFSMDTKNGFDLYLDEDGYFIILAYGQEYELSGEHYNVVEAAKILPFDENHTFLDISDYILNDREMVPSRNQFASEIENLLKID